MEVRLAPVTARDGVDTRTKENSGKAAAGTGETPCLEVRSQDRDEQSAALSYLIPPGAEVEGSLMNAHWTNYLRLVDTYVQGDSVHFFKFKTFESQQSVNERNIERECRKLGGGEEMLNVFRQFYNAQVTDYSCNPTTLTLNYATELLEKYNEELSKQNRAATVIQHVYREFKTPKVEISDTGTFIAEDDKCTLCDEPRMGEFVELCADCYWTEDAHIKRERRAIRHNAIPSNDITLGMVHPELDVSALVNKSIDMTGNAEWETFWANFVKNNLRIHKPKPKHPCECGAESTTRVKHKHMCHPCADFSMNVGRCEECAVVGPRPRDKYLCYDCYDTCLDQDEERKWWFC